jgi:hypothetical protein
MSVLRFQSLTILALVLAAAALGTHARAATISNTYTLTPLVASPGAISNTFSATAPQFNPLLGTLNSVTVVWAMTLNAAGEDDGTGQGSIGVSGGGPTTLNGFAYSGFGFGAAAGAEEEFDSFSFSTSAGNTSNLTSANGIIFSNAIGAGTIPYAYTLNSNFNASSVITAQAVFAGTVQVDYNFTPIPEPSSFALAGLALCGMVRFVRRRNPNLKSQI